jgi:hypothetical protein
MLKLTPVAPEQRRKVISVPASQGHTTQWPTIFVSVLQEPCDNPLLLLAAAESPGAWIKRQPLGILIATIESPDFVQNMSFRQKYSNYAWLGLTEPEVEEIAAGVLSTQDLAPYLHWAAPEMLQQASYEAESIKKRRDRGPEIILYEWFYADYLPTCTRQQARSRLHVRLDRLAVR